MIILPLLIEGLVLVKCLLRLERDMLDEQRDELNFTSRSSLKQPPPRDSSRVLVRATDGLCATCSP